MFTLIVKLLLQNLKQTRAHGREKLDVAIELGSNVIKSTDELGNNLILQQMQKYFKFF